MTIALERTPADNGFHNRALPWVMHFDGDDEATLDGDFTAAELREIADRMEQRP